jgi:hypothetical protein
VLKQFFIYQLRLAPEKNRFMTASNGTLEMRLNVTSLAVIEEVLDDMALHFKQFDKVNF